MATLFSKLRELLRRESPSERYERLCYEAEQEEKKAEREKI